MRFIIKHQSRNRIRVHFVQKRMTCEQADTLLYYLQELTYIQSAKVYERTADATIYYDGDKEKLIADLRAFSYKEVEVPEGLLQHSGRELNAVYQEKIVKKVLFRYLKKLFLPYPLRMLWIGTKSIRYFARGARTLWHRKIQVPVLDATAIGVSILRSDFKTAGSIMFLLEIGELLEEWTHKKSVDDLARTMSLNVGKVWIKQDGQEILVNNSQVQVGDTVVVHMGNVIPFDGIVSAGEAMINQSSLTGESVAVRKVIDNYVYAGTVVEEGNLALEVKEIGGSSRYEKIVKMIEDSEKLKSNLESNAEHLADKLVPYSLGGTLLTYLLTRNVTKTLSILMVDFSCALKLAMPISVLSAIREANHYRIMVKGGKYLELISAADTIVFDKTGTLTKAKPTVAEVVSFNGQSEDELLRIAACLEEHFPHSIAKAVVDAAKEKGLDHEEMHSEVEYIVAHGISTAIEGKKAVIGSYHFVFEDEKCVVPEGMQERFESLPEEYSHLYLAIENRLAAVICIEDPLRQESYDIVTKLKNIGFSKIVMMTGDSEKTASKIAKTVGVDEYYAEVLPEDKANFIEKEKTKGRTVVMIGDGINDSPALSAADVGIAISEGAEIAREIADITLSGDSLEELVTLKELSDALMKRIKWNYRTIVGFNAGLIMCGVGGLFKPTTSALLHNTSTILIGLRSTKNLLEKQ